MRCRCRCPTDLWTNPFHLFPLPFASVIFPYTNIELGVFKTQTKGEETVKNEIRAERIEGGMLISDSGITG